jgi:hypothetical protein
MLAWAEVDPITASPRPCAGCANTVLGTKRHIDELARQEAGMWT